MPRHYKAITLLAIAIALMPFLGLPRGIVEVFVVAAAFLIALIAYVHGKKRRVKQSALSFGEKDPYTPFSENAPREETRENNIQDDGESAQKLSE